MSSSGAVAAGSPPGAIRSDPVDLGSEGCQQAMNGQRIEPKQRTAADAGPVFDASAGRGGDVSLRLLRKPRPSTKKPGLVRRAERTQPRRSRGRRHHAQQLRPCARDARRCTADGIRASARHRAPAIAAGNGRGGATAAATRPPVASTRSQPSNEDRSRTKRLVRRLRGARVRVPRPRAIANRRAAARRRSTSEEEVALRHRSSTGAGARSAAVDRHVERVGRDRDRRQRAIARRSDLASDRTSRTAAAAAAPTSRSVRPSSSAAGATSAPTLTRR